MLKAASRRIPVFLKPISILALNHRTFRGGTPLYKPYRYVPPQRVGVFAPFWSENGYTLCLLVWNLVWFSRELRECLNLFIVYRKKDKYANSKWMLRNSFCCCSNLSNNGIIFQRPGLKTGVKNDIFWSEIGSGFGEPGDRPPPRILRSTPSPGTYLVLRTFVF